jgi:hypothetical protein
VPGHETADQLVRTGSEHPFIGPEPVCGISIGVIKKVVREWPNENHKKHWDSTAGLKQAKELIPGPSAKRRICEVKHRPIKMGGSTIYRTLSPKMTHF